MIKCSENKLSYLCRGLNFRIPISHSLAAQIPVPALRQAHQIGQVISLYTSVANLVMHHLDGPTVNSLPFYAGVFREFRVHIKLGFIAEVLKMLVIGPTVCTIPDARFSFSETKNYLNRRLLP
jgi:hypothetical protein